MPSINQENLINVSPDEFMEGITLSAAYLLKVPHEEALCGTW